MWFNNYGTLFSVTTFGESHGPSVGAVIDGVRGNLEFDINELRDLLKSRHPGGKLSSSRREEDDPVVLSGIYENRTTGAPICIILKNRDIRPADYDQFKNIIRPGHGEWGWFNKFGIVDHRGGGRISGRETAGRVIAGYFALKLLSGRNINIKTWVSSIGPYKFPVKDISYVKNSPYRIPDPEMESDIEQYIQSLAGDSIGGKVRVVIENVPTGLGDPVFGKLDALLAGGLMSIGGVKGISIGAGFEVPEMRGSIYLNGEVEHNYSGGITGGITNGRTIDVELAIKPVPSVNVPVNTTDFDNNSTSYVTIGRHDICLAPKISEVAKSMAAIIIYDALMVQESIENISSEIDTFRLRINELDQALIEILSARRNISRKIGLLKKENDFPIEDLSREENLWKMWRDLGKTHQLDMTFLQDIFKIIISSSKKEQN
ncbi:chorismate synthase [Myxococcota bacterium]|nr:chorismate synthase [Myxococcota bacterium]MBU1381147.1 chorismate synthase [Myxococcota bacterium]MBU1496719.1 chorismate synthase [Myxococcota bacterium]